MHFATFGNKRAVFQDEHVPALSILLAKWGWSRNENEWLKFLCLPAKNFDGSTMLSTQTVTEDCMDVKSYTLSGHCLVLTLWPSWLCLLVIVGGQSKCNCNIGKYSPRATKMCFQQLLFIIHSTLPSGFEINSPWLFHKTSSLEK